MAQEINEILDVLRERGIDPTEGGEAADLPDIGNVQEGDTIYSTSLAEVDREPEDENPKSVWALDDDRLNDWWIEIERIIGPEGSFGQFPPFQANPRREAPEPQCAWYCPIHFFGHSWGIYIRESCILSCATEIARFVDWRAVQNARARRHAITRQLLRAAFYVFYLHEQFHHKVEKSRLSLADRHGVRSIPTL